MTLKKITGKVHLWLGLFSGIVVFIVGLTGCLLVFEEELSRLFDYGVFQKVEEQNQPYALPSTVFSVADSALRDEGIARAYYTVFLDEPRVNALWALDSTRQYHSVLQNPYSGKVVSEFDYKNSPFTILTHIHVSLLLGEIGTTIISYATLIFVLLMISGIILWKPASRKGYKQRFKVKWDAKPKRLNYDLHNVLGFYMTWIAVFIAISGLVWSFEWVNNSVQWIANGGEVIAASNKKVKSDTATLEKNDNLQIADSIFVAFAGNLPKAKAIRVYKPADSKDALHFTVETTNGSNYARADDYYFDQYSGKLLVSQPFYELSNGEKLRRMNYYIHVGSIAGLTGKLLAFFASLIAASLPVTGFIIWRGRKK